MFKGTGISIGIGIGSGGGSAPPSYTDYVNYTVGSPVGRGFNVNTTRVGQSTQLPAAATAIQLQATVWKDNANATSGVGYRLAIYAMSDYTTAPTGSALATGPTLLVSDLSTTNPHPTKNITTEVTGLTLNANDYVWVGLEYVGTPSVSGDQFNIAGGIFLGVGQEWNFTSGSWAAAASIDLAITAGYL